MRALLTDGRRGEFRVKAAVSVSDRAEFWLYDVIDSWADEWWGGVSAAMVVEALQSFGGSPLTIHVNCPGGEVFEALAMYSTIKNYPGDVEVRIEGVAASAASYVALAGNRTVIEPNAMIMIHDAWGIEVGNAAEMRKYADLLDKTSQNVATIYEAKAGGTADEWRAAMLEETWYTGAEAVTAGLADTVATDTSAASDEAAMAARWNLSVFSKTPAAVLQQRQSARPSPDGPPPTTPALKAAAPPIVPAPTPAPESGQAWPQSVDWAAFQTVLKGL